MGSIPPEGSVWFLPHILDYVYVGIFFLSAMWLAVSVKVKSTNPEKSRRKLNMQS